MALVNFIFLDLIISRVGTWKQIIIKCILQLDQYLVSSLDQQRTGYELGNEYGLSYGSQDCNGGYLCPLAVLFHGVMCSEILVDVELGTIKGLVDREPAVEASLCKLSIFILNAKNS